jgi:hypothetical protein
MRWLESPAAVRLHPLIASSMKMGAPGLDSQTWDRTILLAR